MALVERLGIAPDRVCLGHNVYLEDTNAGLKAVIYKANERILLGLSVDLRDAEWIPI